MVTINKKLGNGFVFNNVNSTLDQDHYFGGHTKTIELSIRGAPGQISGSTVLNTGTIFNGIAYNNDLNTLYVCGQHQVTSTLSGVLGSWWVLSSSDQGNTWGIVDDYLSPTESSSSAEDICYDFLSASMLIAGWHTTTGAHTENNSQINGLIRSIRLSGTVFTSRDYIEVSASETKFLWVDAASANGYVYNIQSNPTAFAHFAGGYTLSSSGYTSSKAFVAARTFSVPRWSSLSSSFSSGTAGQINAVFYDGKANAFDVSRCSVGGFISVTGSMSQSYLAHDIAGAFVVDLTGSAVYNGIYSNYNTFIPTSGNFASDFFLDGPLTGSDIILYGCGYLTSSAGKSWFLRKDINKHKYLTRIFSSTIDVFDLNGSDSVANKIIVDDVFYVATGHAGINAIVCKNKGTNTYVVGYHKKDQSAKKYWTIRRSFNELDRKYNTDSTGSWANVEIISEGNDNEAKNGCFDVNGNLYVCGQINGVGVVRKYMSASLVKNALQPFTITGSQEIVLKQEIYDRSNNPITKYTDRLSSSFGLGILSSSGNNLLYPRMSFMVSCSNGIFNESEFSVKFKDDHSSVFKTFQEFRNFGDFFYQKDGWYKFESSFLSSSETLAPSMEFFSSSVNWMITGSGDDIYYTFKDFRIDFLAPMTNAGVEYYKKLDNQFVNKKSSYFNFNLLKPNTLLSKGNYTEFPHAAGIYQMPNMIIGTQTTGKVGTTEDNIIQAKYVGSVVNVFWPKQDVASSVRGFGDFSSGQKAGKLTTKFIPGQEFNVTEFDHLSLYCYLRKETSGTLDNISIIVERKPLHGVGYATDQSIEYAVSGSKTSATLRDVEFNKAIDYGDLSIAEIGYPIDIPLENVKFLRISAKQTNGQSSDVNKNLIVWGRLINSNKNHNET